MDELAAWAAKTPDRPAVIFPQSGRMKTFRDLDEEANRLAQAFIARGLAAGDMIAVLLENRPEIFTIAWAARRAGLYYAMLNTHLRPREIAALLDDCTPRLLIASTLTAPAIDPLVQAAKGRLLLWTDAAPEAAGGEEYAAWLARHPLPAPLPPRPVGREFLYSSGTTGRPKGILRPLLPPEQRGLPQPGDLLFDRLLAPDETSVYLSPAPLYHAAPHVYSLYFLSRGAPVVVLEKFLPEDALAAIERYRVTHSQWVPTMFVRLLALPEAVRAAYDLSSHRKAVHAAAPCPLHVKERMIAWWGPILAEYYAGSERIGTTWIETPEWLTHKGSVGRAVSGEVHILDEEGRELPPGEVGTVWFAGAAPFTYHNAPEKTAATFNERGWATLGDLGYLDAEGYLYLSDRRADLILSGGVNVYPAEIESVLLEHPLIADAAAVGIPHPDLGEVVLAVVQAVEDPLLVGLSEEAVIAFCRERLASIKCPRRVVFVETLPRTPTGKLLRRELKEHYRSVFKADPDLPSPAVEKSSAS
jgi:long-chain acyl-CoA synthetase